MKLNDVHHGIHKRQRPTRVGRGTGSGHGKTAGGGGKGQTVRAGWFASVVFQGGAMPLVRRVPKRGFANSFASAVVTVNVDDLERAFRAGEEVNPDTLRAKRLVKTRYEVLKVLGDGTLSKALKVSAHRFSQAARDKITQAGGEVLVLPGKTTVAEKKQGKGKK
jgi:large subunit ribosomal protein L15